jgi:hypothetical protein
MCFAKSTSGCAMARARRPEFREYLRRECPLWVDEASDSDAERSRAPSGNPKSVAEIGGHRPEPTPRLEKAECCLVSFVERFLRRPRGRWPHGTNGISLGWLTGGKPAQEIDRAGSFLTQQLALAVRGGFARVKTPRAALATPPSSLTIHARLRDLPSSCRSFRAGCRGLERPRARTDSFVRSINPQRGDFR